MSNSQNPPEVATRYMKDPRIMPCFKDSLITGTGTAFGLALVVKVLLNSTFDVSI